ncbi:hypothetical protein RNZ50_03215 [Paracoccaceae bacterium Fryx2]|nr:hypothetical protein [Paracoccaceae bacterium Fryx2]
MRAVSLSIGHLHLHGFSPAEARRVEDRFRDELARLLADADGFAQLAARTARARIDGSPSPEQVGEQAARALVDRLREGPGP